MVLNCLRSLSSVVFHYMFEFRYKHISGVNLVSLVVTTSAIIIWVLDQTGLESCKGRYSVTVTVTYLTILNLSLWVNICWR